MASETPTRFLTGQKKEHVIHLDLIQSEDLVLALQKHGQLVAYNIFDAEKSPKAEPVAAISIKKHHVYHEFSTLAFKVDAQKNKIDVVVVEEKDVRRQFIHWFTLKKNEGGVWEFTHLDKMDWADGRYGSFLRALTFVELEDEPQRKVLAGCEFERKKYLRLFELVEETGKVQKLDIDGQDEDEEEVYHPGDWPHVFAQAEGSKRHYSVDELGWLNILTVGKIVA